VYPHFLQSLSFRFLTGVDPAACCVGLPLTTWLDPCFIALSWSRQYSASVLNPLPMNQFPNLASIAACQCQFFVTIPRLHRELQYGICPPKRRHNYFNCSCSYATLPTVASFSIPGPPHEKINALLALSLVDVPCESIDVGVPKFFAWFQVWRTLQNGNHFFWQFVLWSLARHGEMSFNRDVLVRRRQPQSGLDD